MPRLFGDGAFYFLVENHLELCYNPCTSHCELRIVNNVVALAGVCPQKEVVEAPDAYALS
jgi:hypothetical protein